MNQLIVSAEINTLITEGALFVINDSAGKDSQAMKILLMKVIPHRQLVIVHANLPEVEWEGNIEHIKQYAEDIPVFEVRAGKTFFEMVEHRQMFPSPSHRQCTSDLKRQPIQKFINRYCKENGFTKVVNCMGLRGQESPSRAKKEVFKVNERATVGHRAQFDWLPIHHLLIRDVWEVISSAGQKRHYAYDEGMSRLSCVFCIMSNKEDIKTAARLRPALAERYIETEKRIGFTMSMSRTPLSQIINS